ncbi:MAG: hypothetical protein ABSC55_20740 [Syntrophorhabdales bacterium]|jgi:hypothetical protein
MDMEMKEGTRMAIGATSSPSPNATTLLVRYQKRLETIPSPGGNGCHVALLAAANLGIMAGVSPGQIFSDLRAAIPTGKRFVTDREIGDAISKALLDHNGGTFTPRPRPAPVVQDGKSALRKIIGQSRYSDEADLWEASPIRLLDEP